MRDDAVWGLAFHGEVLKFMDTKRTLTASIKLIVEEVVRWVGSLRDLEIALGP